MMDYGKTKFDITAWEDKFKAKVLPVPTNEIEFREIIKGKKFSVKHIADKIEEKTGWDDETLNDECPDNEQKVDKFFELYEVVYPVSESAAPPNENEEETKKTAPAVESDLESMTLEEAQKFLKEHHGGLEKDVDGKILVRAPSVFYENLSITVNSDFIIECSADKNLSRNNVFILDDDKNKVIAVGRIVHTEENDLITIDKDRIDFSAFINKTKFNIALPEVDNDSLIGKLHYTDINMTMQEMKATNHVLCIDFGTCNTTVGSYRLKDGNGSEPELVFFADSTQENCLVNYFPTIVYVENCEDRDNIVYKFGFDAKKLEKSGNYQSSASVFYQIKHWLIEDSYYPETVTLVDIKGNTTDVPKKEVVRAYLKQVIMLSEDYFGVKFKELHFSAPVKMKHRFIEILKELLSDYTIIEDGIDEAGAILFDYVADRFTKWYPSDKTLSGNVAVIDCGGGTTDLATCEYEFSEKSGDAKISRIRMDTKFSSGDFNYGGNNITYRIMQLIKMKLAVKYGFIEHDEFNEVMERSENDILLNADREDYDTSALYEKYDKLYNRCEEFIPTRFDKSSNKFFDRDIPLVKRNFYYLWQFSEQVKIIFYREEKEVKRDKWDDAIQAIGDLKLNYLYRKDGKGLKRLEDSPFDNLEITITEIRKVIFGDIYNLLNRILNLDKKGLPENTYDFYRLSGQSCKINLFNELLKEFIPGKSLRAKMEGSVENVESMSLKRRCIDGSIRYIMYKRLHMQAELISVPKPAERIYRVGIITGLNGDEFPAEKDDKTIALFPVKPELTEVTAVVRNAGKEIRRISISMHISHSTEYDNPDKIKDRLNKGDVLVDWEGTRDKLAELKFNEKEWEQLFIVAVPAGRGDGYGFYVYFIKKIGEDSRYKYRITEGEYYNYEDTSSGFFDGKR